jgi:hypothetical protein
MSLDVDELKLFIRRHGQKRIIVNRLRPLVADVLQEMLDIGVITDAELEDEELRTWLGDLNLRDILND